MTIHLEHLLGRGSERQLHHHRHHARLRLKAASHSTQPRRKTASSTSYAKSLCKVPVGPRTTSNLLSGRTWSPSSLIPSRRCKPPPPRLVPRTTRTFSGVTGRQSQSSATREPCVWCSLISPPSSTAPSRALLLVCFSRAQRCCNSGSTKGFCTSKALLL